jgi:diguanylate cyclase (GGDEF)-like protein/PAS domain S-box-containing protein
MKRQRSPKHGAPEQRELQDPNTLKELVLNIREGIYITTPIGKILDGNPALMELLGVGSLQELRSYTAGDFCVDPGQLRDEHELLERDGTVKDFELDMRRPDGTIITVLDTSYLVRDPETGSTRLYGILIDITHRKDLERKLKNLLVRDPLTGCYNRRYLEQLETRADADPAALGAIIVDIDNFKHYNDLYGHSAGDEVLIKVAHFLTRQARAEDAVIRIGGDEFLVILLGESVESTKDVARRYAENAARSAPVPISMGWAVRGQDETVEQTVERADHGLMHVRMEERGRVQRRSGDGLKSPL